MEEHGDATQPIEELKPSINYHKKTALIFISTFMGITVTFFVIYIYLMSIHFEDIFDLDNMTLVFCVFLFTCIFYVTCAIVGVKFVIQASSKKQLNYLQFVLLMIMLFNIGFPTITLSGTCSGSCKNVDMSSTFQECMLNPNMTACQQLCEIRSSIMMMPILAFLCVILHIAIRALWDGIVDRDPYANWELNNNSSVCGRHGYDGIIPMFIIPKENEKWLYGDVDDTAKLENNVVIVLPEHEARIKEELLEEVKSTIRVIITDSSNPGQNKSKFSNKKPHQKHSKNRFLGVEVENEPEPLPTFSRKEYKSDNRSKKALDLLRGATSRNSDASFRNPPPISTKTNIQADQNESAKKVTDSKKGPSTLDNTVEQANKPSTSFSRHKDNAHPLSLNSSPHNNKVHTVASKTKKGK